MTRRPQESEPESGDEARDSRDVDDVDREGDLEAAPVDRWEFIRDVLVFQLKLGLDAIRDLVLVPVSLAAAAVDLLSGHDPARNYFYRAFALGRRSDVWIDLFGTYADEASSEEPPQSSVDSLVGQLERLIVDEYERGGITASAKDAIDSSLDGISGRKAR